MKKYPNYFNEECYKYENGLYVEGCALNFTFNWLLKNAFIKNLFGLEYE